MLIIIHNKQCLLALLVVVPDARPRHRALARRARTWERSRGRRERQAGEAMQLCKRHHVVARRRQRSRSRSSWGCLDGGAAAAPIEGLLSERGELAIEPA